MSEEQYNRVCKDRFDQVISAVDKLSDRMFKDNGTKSYQTQLNKVLDWQEQHDKNTIEAVEKVHMEAKLAVEQVRVLAAQAVKVADNKHPPMNMEWLFGNWKRIGVTLGAIIWMTIMTYTTLTSASSEQITKVTEKLNTVIKDVNK